MVCATSIFAAHGPLRDVVEKGADVMAAGSQMVPYCSVLTVLMDRELR